MQTIYNDILKAKAGKRKLLAILLDPDKIDLQKVELMISKINQSGASHIFIGGSLVLSSEIDELIDRLKQNCTLPIVLFPGNPSQISDKADGILFLSLISGRNPDFLIGHQVDAAPILIKTKLEVISTGYILVESGGETAVSSVSQTKPLGRDNPQAVVATALAGEMLGNKLIYLEAGSGAKLSVPMEIIALVSSHISVPLIVGGGIRSKEGIEEAYYSGADLVVIGTAFENDLEFFNN